MLTVRSLSDLCFSGLAFAGFSLLLSSAKPAAQPITQPAVQPFAIQQIATQPFTTARATTAHTATVNTKPTARAAHKTEGAQGVFVDPAADCDGDGFNNDSRIDFDGDGIADDCILDAREDIPEPPFQQSFTPSPEQFNTLIPDVGWNAQYQCGDGLYQVTLSRPSENELRYSADGITLSTPVVYDDIDPNLNQPLIVQDPTRGVRYSFQQELNGEFYEYAIADYSGNVGLYVYQTGEQVVAAPCQISASESVKEPAAVLSNSST